MNLGPSKEMPQYRCHKVVRAAKITEVRYFEASMVEAKTTVQIELKEIDGMWITDLEWADKHQPEAGGYIVQYEDGYRSYSPAKAFEEGYIREDSLATLVVRYEDFADWLDEVVPGVSDKVKKYWQWLGLPKEKWGGPWFSNAEGMTFWNGSKFVFNPRDKS